jgi:cytochrome c-type biogenesis protein CcmH
VLSLLALGPLAWTLLGHPGRSSNASALNDGQQEHSVRLQLYRQRKSEITADLGAGRLSAQDADRQIELLAAELGETLDPDEARVRAHPPSEAMRPARNPAVLFAGLIVLLLAVSFGLYGRFGTHQILQDGFLNAAAATDAVSLKAQLQEATSELTARTKTNPADFEAWAMLAQAHRMNNDSSAALEAYRRAAVLSKTEPKVAQSFGTEAVARLHADYAETMVKANNDSFNEPVLALLNEALRFNPNDPKAMGLLGVGLYKNGRLSEALTLMQRLNSSLTPGSEQANQVDSLVKRMQSELAAPNPNSTLVALQVSGTIQLAEPLKAQFVPGMTLFVVARTPEGSRIPVAAQKIPLETLPARFSLSDAQNMTSERKLSEQKSIVIEARLSKSGNAIRQPGDLFGALPAFAPTAAAAASLTIIIDQIVP